MGLSGSKSAPEPQPRPVFTPTVQTYTPPPPNPELNEPRRKFDNTNTAPAPNPELKEPWRIFDWTQQEVLKKKLENFSLSKPDVKDIKILVAGQIGAGKSSFINSINSAFQGRITSRALVNSSAGDSRSFTQDLKGFTIKSGKKSLPFVFNDVMGLEPDQLTGSQIEDLISAVSGHVKNGYKFNQEQTPTFKDQYGTCDPALSDQTFCLVYIIAADTVQFTDERLNKLKIIENESAKVGQNPDTGCIVMPNVKNGTFLINYLYDPDNVWIPRVIVMTKVDEVCPLVKNNLRKIYTSKKIKEKMELCSTKTGVPLTNIFPVKNYHDEIDTEDDIDVLILKALEQIVQIANVRLEESTNKNYSVVK